MTILIMKQLLAISALLFVLSACESKSDRIAKDAVAQCFETYKAALLSKDGEIAAAQVTQGTIDAYQNYVDLAVSGTREEVQKLPFINRLQVIMMRHCIPLDTLKSLDGSSAIVYAIDQEWIGKEEVKNTKLSDVTISGDRATAPVYVSGLKAGLYKFGRDDDGWKLDLVALMEDANGPLSQMLLQTGETEDGFIFQVAEEASGEEIDRKTIWKPLQ